MTLSLLFAPRARALYLDLKALRNPKEEPMFIIRQYNAVSTRRGFNEALRLALTLRELGWACAILNMDGQVICE